MYAFLVHVEREAVMDWSINVNPDPMSRRTVYNYGNAERVKVEGRIDNPRSADVETWYAIDEKTAEALAKKLASEVPGRHINVYKLCSVSVSNPTPAITSSYSEKGLVPK
jgi:acylphosphatase